MAKKSKSNQLIRGRSRIAWDWHRSNPWRTIVLAMFVVVVSYEGVHQYKIIEAATVEQQANDTCHTYGEKAGPAAAECIADKVLIDDFYPRWNGQNPDRKNCLKELWTRESSWLWYATNPGSGAYGIPQALPATKLASAYNNPKYGTWHDNVVTQERWGLDYISGRYGNPCAAWNHEVAYGWY